MITYKKTFFGQTKFYRLYGSAFPRAFLLTLPSVIFCAVLEVLGVGDNVQYFTNPTYYMIFSGLVAFFLTFRASLSYQRFWDGRIQQARFSTKWANSALNALKFDEMAKGEAAATGPLFRKEIAHLTSLMHGLAMQALRGDRDIGNLAYASLAEIPPEAHKDPGKHPEWNKKRSFQSVFTMRKKDHFQWYWKTFQIPVLGGVSEAEAARFQECKGDRTYLVYTWIVQLLTERRHEGGIPIDAPICAGIFNDLSDGRVGFENAARLTDTPFPFPFAQSDTCLVYLVAITLPFLMADSFEEKWLSVVMTSITVFSYFLLNEVAREIEDPFKHDPNDLPLVHMQHQFNEELVVNLKQNWRMSQADLHDVFEPAFVNKIHSMHSSAQQPSTELVVKTMYNIDD